MLTVWDTKFRLPAKVTEPGKIAEYAYDAKGRITEFKETDTSATPNVVRTTALTYNAAGLLASIDGPLAGNKDMTLFKYDAKGNLTGKQNALGQEWLYNPRRPWSRADRQRPQRPVDHANLRRPRPRPLP